MVRRSACQDDDEVARLLIFWTRPAHLSTEEADVWVGAQVRRLLTSAGSGQARLAHAQSAAPSFPRPCDWMLEMPLEDGEDARRRLEAPPWRDWLGDLRLLGMHPAAVVIDDRPGLDAEATS